MSEWLQSLGRASGAPVTSSISEHFDERMSEEVDLVKPINEQIDKLQKDKEAYGNLLIDQYNHMYRQDTKGEQLLSLVKEGYKTATEIEKYRTWLKPMQEYHREYVEPAWKGDVRHVGKGPYDDPEVAREIAAEQQENEVQQEIEKVKADPNTPLDNKLALDNTAVDDQGVSREDKKLYFHQTKTEVLNNANYHLAQFREGLKVPVPMPNGDTEWKTLADASTIKEARYIANSIVYYYLYTNRHLTMGRPGRFKREFALPMMRKIDGLVAARGAELAKGRIEIQEQRRTAELKSKIVANPGYAIDYVNVYKEVFNGDIKLAKMDLAMKLAEAAKNGMDESVINAVLDHEFPAHDSTPEKPHKVKMRTYWKAETRTVLNGVAAFRRSEATELEEQADAALDHDVQKGLAEMREAKKPWTIEQKQEWLKKLMQTHRITYEQLPDAAKGSFTASTIPDYDIDRELEMRHGRGETITAQDIAGIEDYDLKQKWLQKLGSGGIDTVRRDRFINGMVDAKTNNTLGENGKNLEWRAYQDNSIQAYNAAFVAAMDSGSNREEAHTAGQAAVEKGLDLNGRDESWSKYGVFGGQTRNPKDRRNLGLAKNNLAKDRTLIDSEKPWVGEDAVLADAVKYFKRPGKSNIPLYYQQSWGIKKLPNGEVCTPYRLMRYRLNALGLLKDEQPIPEDELPTNLQELLVKPSPAKTLRVINNEEGAPIMEKTIEELNAEFDAETNRLYGEYDPDYVKPDPVQELRSKAQTSQQYALIDSSYRMLVNIPPNLNEEFIAQVGELPPYMRLENLQPEVAKAFVADTLMT